MTKKKDIIIKEEEQIAPCKSIIGVADDLDSQKAITNSTCKLCNSTYREEAEDIYEKTNSLAAVHSYLKKNNEKISQSACRRHIQNHYLKPELNAKLKDYATDLKDWAKHQSTTEERFISHLTLLERDIHLINATTDENNVESLRKSADSIVKLMDQAGKIEERLKKYRDRFEPMEVFVQRFQVAIMSYMEKLESEEARHALVEILGIVEKELEGIINNG